MHVHVCECVWGDSCAYAQGTLALDTAPECGIAPGVRGADTVIKLLWPTRYGMLATCCQHHPAIMHFTKLQQASRHQTGGYYYVLFPLLGTPLKPFQMMLPGAFPSRSIAGSTRDCKQRWAVSLGNQRPICCHWNANRHDKSNPP